MDHIISEYKNNISKMQAQMEKNRIKFNDMVESKGVEINRVKTQLDEQVRKNTVLQSKYDEQIQQNKVLENSLADLQRKHDEQIQQNKVLQRKHDEQIQQNKVLQGNLTQVQSKHNEYIQRNTALQDSLDKLQNDHCILLNNTVHNLGEIQNERNFLKSQLEEQKQLNTVLQNSLGEAQSINQKQISPEPNIFDNLEIKTIIKTVVFGENGEITKTVNYI